MKLRVAGLSFSRYREMFGADGCEKEAIACNGVRLQLAEKKFGFMSGWHRLLPERVSVFLGPS
jgi:hypothetical protein